MTFKPEVRMLEQFKRDLISTITEAIESDMLNDEDALAIVEICKRAADREIANVTEEYLAD